jgi:hypothetical protein
MSFGHVPAATSANNAGSSCAVRDRGASHRGA